MAHGISWLRICTSTELGTLPDIEEEAERSWAMFGESLGIDLDGVVHPSGSFFVDVVYQQMRKRPLEM